MNFPTVTINTKFLNSLQPEWLKYQNTGSSSRQTSSYYVTHPTSVVDYDDEYQQDDVHNNSEDPLVFAMLLHCKANTQISLIDIDNRLRCFNPTPEIKNHSKDDRVISKQEFEATLAIPSSGKYFKRFCATNCSGIGHYAGIVQAKGSCLEVFHGASVAGKTR
ncbi:hypothetical protein Tco_0307094 [Tanacetum coccineum]